MESKQLIVGFFLPVSLFHLRNQQLKKKGGERGGKRKKKKEKDVGGEKKREKKREKATFSQIFICFFQPFVVRMVGRSMFHQLSH